MITQQSVTIFLWLGVIFVLFPSFIHLICLGYKYGYLRKKVQNRNKR